MAQRRPTLDYHGALPPDRSIWDRGWLMFLLYCAFVALLIAAVLAIGAAWYWFHA